VIEADAIRNGVVDMFRVNMGLREGETILVVSDYPVRDQWASGAQSEIEDMVRRCLLGRTVAEIAAKEFPSSRVRFMPFPATGRSGTEPPADVAEAMKQADVVIAITSFSLTHTEARGSACRAGARVASMPRFMPEMFCSGGPMAVDYHLVADETRRFADLLSEAASAEVSSPDGTMLYLDLSGRKGLPDDGMYTSKGKAGNLPAGEAYIAPLEGKAKGKIAVLPGWYPRLREPMTVYVEDGLVVRVDGGGDVGEELRATWGLGEAEPSREILARRNIAELGVGTNPNARRTDIVLEAEKIRGTVHIGIGDNSHMGGVVVADFHQDFVVPKATLVLDGRTVMREGEATI